MKNYCPESLKNNLEISVFNRSIPEGLGQRLRKL
jgi:hypothetical protein